MVSYLYRTAQPVETCCLPTLGIQKGAGRTGLTACKITIKFKIRKNICKITITKSESQLHKFHNGMWVFAVLLKGQLLYPVDIDAVLKA